jgi:hypothetical protein
VALQLPNTTVHHILPKDLSFDPFKVQLIQKLCDDDDLQNNLIMTDEAHFHLSGYVIKQIVGYWAPDNPRKMHQRPFHSSKVTVYCGVASFGVIGPYSFEDQNGDTATPDDMLRKMLADVCDRVEECLRKGGSHLTNIVFKK